MYAVLLIIGLVLSLIVVTTPLSLEAQTLFGVIAVLCALLLVMKRTRERKVIIAVLSAVVSWRYIYWRATETLAFDGVLETFLGYGMFAGELYFLGILALSYLQGLWPNERKPERLPQDTRRWPTVDIYIPTYNEPAELVETTIIAAKNIDWPKDKLKIYVLDDGCRIEFANLAKKLGVGYLTRRDNKGAKAGNLNNALRQTRGDLIAIFDCDHVPTRSFLQLSVGFFLNDEKLALVQTPHHFYNEDPFEKNLWFGNRVPNEGLLFYGLVQDGNDFWNASFFCGSCAILRRKAMQEIGGFATETVTEDAHTSLRLHQMGWNSAYLKLPMAGGLATGAVREHVQQRLRWGRGMLQILRLDNPLLIPGLSWAQRFCYLSAMVNFMFPLPRIVLLTAPMVYLLLGLNLMVASPVELLAYALPHVLVAVMATLFLQSRYRQAFFTEAYETTLAFHLLIPLVRTLMNPNKGKFNVTNKKRTSQDTYFDWQIVFPQLCVALVLFLSVVNALFTLFGTEVQTDEVWSLTINIVWASISMLILLLCSAVALEKRDGRSAHRLSVSLPVVLQTGGGYSLDAEVTDMSLHGARLKLSDPGRAESELKPDQSLNMSVAYSGSDIRLPVRCMDYQRPGVLRVAFQTNNVEQHHDVVKVLFSRANAWVDWDRTEEKGFLASVIHIAKAVLHFLLWLLKAPFRKTPPSDGNGPTIRQGETSIEPVTERSLRDLGQIGAGSALVWLSALLLSVVLWLPPSAMAQPGLDSAIVQDLDQQHFRFSLRDIGVNEPIYLQGLDTSRGFSFSLRSDQVIAEALMTLRVSISPGLDPVSSHLSVIMNGEVVHTLALDQEFISSKEVKLTMSPYLFQTNNTLEFKVVANKLGDVDNSDRNDKSVWIQISNSSHFLLASSQLNMNLNLGNLPAPFFDRNDYRELVLPFVFADSPSNLTLQAAAVTASWWGALSSYRGASFPVQFEQLPKGNAVVFLTEGATVEGIEGVHVSGPSLEVLRNPVDEFGQLLLIKGRTEDELLVAAKALATSDAFLNGKSSDVTEPSLSARLNYDAPAWVPDDRAVTFSEVDATANLEGYGLSPGVLTLNFKVAPDFFLWGDKGFPVKLRLRYPGKEWLDLEHSRLDILINDHFIKSVSLATLSDSVSDSVKFEDFLQSQTEFKIPPYLVYGENQLQFFFDLKPRVNEQNYRLMPSRLRIGIDSVSTIDFSNAYRFARMPNLAYLAQSGLPFSRKADLSDTVIVVPDSFADEKTLQAILTLLGSISAKTEYPATGVTVVSSTKAKELPDKDYIVFGGFDNQPLFREWSNRSPLKINDTNVSITKASRIESWRNQFNNLFSEEKFTADTAIVPRHSMAAALFSYQSPADPQRSVVGFLANRSEGFVKTVDALKSRDEKSRIKGDFVVINNNEILGFTASPPYYVGHLPWHIHLRWFVKNNTWLLPPLFLMSVLLLSLFLIGRAKIKASKRFEIRKNHFLSNRDELSTI